MCVGTYKGEYWGVAFYAVDKQPIWSDMTFSKILVIATETVVTISKFEFLTICKFCNSVVLASMCIVVQ
jgi:hypothetical protein